MSKTTTRRNPAATLSPTQLKEIENELANALIDKDQAKQYFENARTYLMQCTSRAQELKAKLYFAGKEVQHG